MESNVPVEIIENKIYVIRGYKVMLDKDLGNLYGVKTQVLNQAVKRNNERFPEDFMFSLTRQEILRISQIVISSEANRTALKFVKNMNVFTEQGIAMLSGILRSKRAIQVNIAIMRTFVKLRRILATNSELAHKFRELEGRVTKHDSNIVEIYEAIRKMLMVPEKPARKIGFVADRENE